MFELLAPWAWWLILAGILFVIEIVTVSFFAFWPGMGAVFASISCIFTDNVVVQTAVFVVTSTLMILFMKPLAKRIFKTKDVPMNNRSFIGKNAIVTQTISNINSKGQVKINGELWSAISENEEEIEKGATVLVQEINGVKLVVKKI